MRKIASLAMAAAVLIQIALLPAPSAAASRADYNYVFENQNVLEFDLQMTEESFEKMQPIRKTPNFEQPSARSLFAQEFPYVPATVTCGGAVYPNAGARYRGNASITIIPEDGKKPFKLDFDRFEDGQNFHGFSKLNFINCFRDPSMLRDKLAYDLYNRVGVPAPRAAFANVTLSLQEKPVEPLGFFVVVEQVNAPFLEKHFGNADGLLIKFEITNDLEYRGDDWQEYERDCELKSDNKADTKHLVKFLKFLYESSDEEFAKKIEDKINIDRFLAWLAVDALLVDLDSYAGLGHNWYMYYNTDSRRFEFIPWDVNESFGNLQIVSPEKLLDFDVRQPYMGDRILIRRILNVEKYRTIYEFYLRTFIRDYFNPEFMGEEIDRLHALIDGSVKNDANPLYAYEDFQNSVDRGVEPKYKLLSQEIIGLKPFVQKRSDSVLAQLAGTKQGETLAAFNPGDLNAADRAPMPPSPPKDAETLKRIDALKERLEALNQSIKENPEDAELYVQKGETLGQLCQLLEPMEQMTYGMEIGTVFEKAVELDPNNVGARIGRGAVRLLTPEMFGGNLDGAISDFEFALSIIPDNETVNNFMGMACVRKDRKEDAKKYLQKALEANPNNQQAKDLLESIQ